MPPKKNRKSKPAYDWNLYKKRHLIENMFAKLKHWRRVANRYDRCAHIFISAIYIAASVIFYLKTGLKMLPPNIPPEYLSFPVSRHHSMS
ncbi:transposase [Acetobacter okinawensis]|nr:transposase [Acetobacter okinawensis]